MNCSCFKTGIILSNWLNVILCPTIDKSLSTNNPRQIVRQSNVKLGRHRSSLSKKDASRCNLKPTHVLQGNSEKTIELDQFSDFLAFIHSSIGLIEERAISFEVFSLTLATSVWVLIPQCLQVVLSLSLENWAFGWSHALRAKMFFRSLTSLSQLMPSIRRGYGLHSEQKMSLQEDAIFVGIFAGSDWKPEISFERHSYKQNASIWVSESFRLSGWFPRNSGLFWKTFQNLTRAIIQHWKSVSDNLFGGSDRYLTFLILAQFQSSKREQRK